MLLRKWCISHRPEIFLIPIRAHVAEKMIPENSIAIDRVIELSVRNNLDPIIMVKDGTSDAKGAPNVLLVDGHHRYFLAYIRKQELIQGYLIEEPQWRPFQIHWMPDLTKEQLIKTPITKRRY